MTTDKEELRKEFYKVMEYSEPFGNEYHSELFDWVMGKLEAKDKECAAKIAAGERLRVEDAMSAINEANGLREKIKDQELIIHGIEEGAEQWESLCKELKEEIRHSNYTHENKDKKIAELKSDKERLTKACNYIQSSRNELDQQITDLKAEIERLKGNADSVAREWQHDDLVMLKDLYNACCKYEKERQGLMSWEIPSLHRAKQILSRKYPDMTFDEDGRLIYRPEYQPK